MNNIDDLKKYYFNQRFKSLEKIFNAKIKAIDKATKIASKAMNKRLEGMNYIRHQLDTQASSFITRKELIAILIAEIALVSLIVSILLKLLT